MSAKPRRALVDVESARVVAPLAILVTCALLVLMQLYVAIPLAPVLGEDLASRGGAVALGSVYSLAYGLGFLIFGPLSDRYGRKAVLVPGIAALAVATAALSLASSMAAIGVLRAVQGLLASSFAAVALAYVGEGLPRRWRSTGVGAVATAFLVAGIVGQVYAQVVAQAFGWRWVFGVAAPVFALCAVGLRMILIELPLDRSPARLAQRYRELAALAREPRLGLVYAAACTVLLSFVAMYATLGPVLETRFGLDHGEVLLVRLAGLPGMVLSPLAGWLVGRFGATRVTVTGFVLAATGLTVQAITAATLWGLVLGSAVFVAGIATVVPAMITLIGSRAGSARGGALGLSGLALFIGASLGPLAPDLSIGFSGLLLCLASLLLLGAALVTISSRTTANAKA